MYMFQHRNQYISGEFSNFRNRRKVCAISVCESLYCLRFEVLVQAHNRRPARIANAVGPLNRRGLILFIPEKLLVVVQFNEEERRTYC